MLEAPADALRSAGRRGNAPAAATIRAGSAEAQRSPRTALRRPGTTRSTTGARSTSKPRRASIAPRGSPARRAAPRCSPPSAARAPGASRSRRRSTGPPSWSRKRIARRRAPAARRSGAVELRLALDVAPEEDDAARRMRGEDLALARARATGPARPTPKSRELTSPSAGPEAPRAARARRSASSGRRRARAASRGRAPPRRRRGGTGRFRRSRRRLRASTGRALHVELLLLEVREHLARPGRHRGRAVPRAPRRGCRSCGRRAPGTTLRRNTTRPPTSLHGHRRVDDRRLDERDLRQLVVVRGEEDERGLARACRAGTRAAPRRSRGRRTWRCRGRPRRGSRGCAASPPAGSRPTRASRP